MLESPSIQQYLNKVIICWCGQSAGNPLKISDIFEGGKAMEIILEPRWIEKITTLPESGMGYHRVKIKLRGEATTVHGIVLNGTTLVVDSQFYPDEIEDIDIDS